MAKKEKSAATLEPEIVEAAEAAEKKPIKKLRPQKTERKPSARFLALAKKIEDRSYPLDKAVELAIKGATAKFDETLEVHFRLGIDPKLTSQHVRGSIKLPYGTGKKMRILAFAEGLAAEQASEAGATVANEEITSQIEKGHIPFDLVVATPDEMPKIARLARILGVRGLMPNPKSGTVSTDIVQTIKERSLGLVDFKNENALLHLSFGKASFSPKEAEENLQAIYQAVQLTRPPKTSGEFIRSMTITSTMSPALRVDLSSINHSKS